MPNIGPLELVILLVIVLLIFGPKRLPGLGRQLGTGMREFKDSITGKDKGDDDAERAFGDEGAKRAVDAAPVEQRTPPADDQPAIVAGDPGVEGDAPRADG